MAADTQYDNQFYAAYKASSSGSAAVIAPIVAEMFSPASVIDVGCGIGTWLAAFANIGVETISGVDGDYVSRSNLLIPAARFLPHDLRTPIPDTVIDSDRYDVAVSLEVGEHLPAERAGTLVDSLTRLSDVVVFSAAIPHQGGTDHINERWPGYWASLFAGRGYAVFDCIRPRVWGDDRVAYYYAQNALVYICEDTAARFPEIAGTRRDPTDPCLAKVHPRKWEAAHDPTQIPLRRLLSALPTATGQAMKRRVGK